MAFHTMTGSENENESESENEIENEIYCESEIYCENSDGHNWATTYENTENA